MTKKSYIHTLTGGVVLTRRLEAFVDSQFGRWYGVVLSDLMVSYAFALQDIRSSLSRGVDRAGTPETGRPSRIRLEVSSWTGKTGRQPVSGDVTRRTHLCKLTNA